MSTTTTQACPACRRNNRVLTRVHWCSR